MMTDEVVVAADAEWRRWTERFTWHLDQVPLLLGTMRELAVPLGAFQYDRPHVDSSMDGSPLPFREGIVDEADDLWAALVQYASNVSALLGDAAPAALRGQWRTRQEVAGLRAAVDLRTVRAQAFEIVAWLIDRVDRIAELAELADSEDFLFSQIRAARARYTAAPTRRRVRPRPCDVCGEVAVVAAWVDGPEGKAVQIARCATCGQVYEGE